VRLAAALLKPGRNVLELDVTNLAANRIRDMDQAQTPVENHARRQCR